MRRWKAKGLSFATGVFSLICLFIPGIIVVATATSAMVFLVRKVYAYVQTELEKLKDTPAKQYTDTAFIVYIKGEKTKTAAHRCLLRSSEIVERSTTRMAGRARNTSTSKTRNNCRNRIQPPPVEELILLNSICSTYITKSVSLNSTHIPQQLVSGIMCICIERLVAITFSTAARLLQLGKCRREKEISAITAFVYSILW